MHHPHRYCVLLGTRPEAVKLAPVVRELRRRGKNILLCSTGQHREMLYQALADFDLAPDIDLGVMTGNQSLAGLSAALLTGLDELFGREKPSWALVQGDTTSVLMASLCACYHKTRVGHVEAGLRSFDKSAPWPEEINRRCAGVMADLHFAPTSRAVENLKRENTRDSAIVLTGNTVVDALCYMRSVISASDLPEPARRALAAGRRLVLVTCHRRESFGRPLRRVFAAIRRLAALFADVCIVYPVHLNPNVREPAMSILDGVDNIALVPPLAYRRFIALMDKSTLVLSDSGGVQEEAPSFHKPLLVLRDTTERPEGLEAGVAKLVGTDEERIVAEAARLLADKDAWQAMAGAANPYGDGHAAERICDALEYAEI
ncbi:MAG: UDP-N-acetylglucosamine 2-epimerase (non-hydrolyzing) [Desulfovibrio sp.]|jgi:UDP-N-acetylglucosamine 2-epimerase|nr:UDP-N-acetylglucosamine 2-epimerase (non-hydrolyzing) [Desulfovibrio sp.]